MAQFNATFSKAVVSGNIITGTALSLTDTSPYGQTDPNVIKEQFNSRKFIVKDSNQNIIFEQLLIGNEDSVLFSLGGLLTLQQVFISITLELISFDGTYISNQNFLLPSIL